MSLLTCPGNRTHYDDEDEDDIYATREPHNGGGARGDRGAIGQSSRDGDPVEATKCASRSGFRVELAAWAATFKSCVQ